LTGLQVDDAGSLACVFKWRFPAVTVGSAIHTSRQAARTSIASAIDQCRPFQSFEKSRGIHLK
jgi:hypothetical protein